MLNKRLVVALLAVVVLFLGIFSFAQSGDDENQTPGIVDENETDNENNDDDPIIGDETNEEDENDEVTPVNNPGRAPLVLDTTAPVITLTGDAEIDLEVGGDFTDPGATATENATVDTTGTVNTEVAGIYTLTYNAADEAGNEAEAITRKVIVRPVIEIPTSYEEGIVIDEADETGKTIIIQAGVGLIMPDVRAMISVGNYTNEVTSTTTDIPVGLGTYTITYTYELNTENGRVAAKPLVITVMVVDTLAPNIIVNGNPTHLTNKDVTLVVNALDNLTTVELLQYSFDGGVNWSLDNTATFAGNGTVNVWVKDALDNIAKTDVIINKIDREVIKVTKMLPNGKVEPIRDTKPRISATAKEGFAINGGLKFVWTSSATQPADEEFVNNISTGGEISIVKYAQEIKDYIDNPTGLYYLWFRMEDKVGNIEYYRTSSFNMDNDVPTISVTGNPTHLTNKDVTLVVNALDNLTTVELLQYSFDGGVNWSLDNTATFAENGTVNVWVKDEAGNIAKLDVVIDKIDREVIKVTKMLPNGKIEPIRDTKPRISATAKEGFAINGGLKFVWTSSATQPANEEFVNNISTGGEISIVKYAQEIKDYIDNPTGLYYLWFRMEDKVGNIEYYRTSSFNMDNDAPTVSITGNPTDFIDGDVILTVIAEDNITTTSQLKYSFDGGVNWSLDNTATFAENGTVNVWVKDEAGNIAKLDVVIDKIDKTAPVIEGVENNGVYNRNVLITVIEQNIESVLSNNQAISLTSLNQYEFSDEGTYRLVVIDKVGKEVEVIFTIGKPMEITTSALNFQADIASYLSVRTIPNSNLDEMVRAHFTLPEGVTLEYREGNVGPWLPLTNVFGPASGFPLKDITTTFRVKFDNVGTETVKVKFKRVSDGVVLGSKDLTATVVSKPMEITTSALNFQADIASYLSVRTIPNSNLDEMVRAHFTLPEGVTLEYREGNVGPWLPLTNVFGPASGFPLKDITTTFRVKFDNVGTETVKVEFKRVSDGVVLGSKDLTATVVSKPMEITTSALNFQADIASYLSVRTIPNSNLDEMVRAHFTLPEGVTLEYREGNVGPWLPLTNVFGPASGFPLKDITTTFRVKFDNVGTETVKVEFKRVSDGFVLGSKDLTATVVRKPMEITTSALNFQADIASYLSVRAIPNSDLDEMVRAHFTLPEGVTLEYREGNVGPWLPLTNVFGPASGFPLKDITTTFRSTFGASGTYPVKVEFKRVSDGFVLGSKDLIANVVD